MKIGIVPYLKLSGTLELTKELLKHFSDEEILLPPNVAEELNRAGTPIEEMNAEALIAIGGDGTVLYTLQKSSETPILGINMGRKGFLADVKPEEAIQAIEELREGKMEVEEREKLRVEIENNLIAEGLNEGVIRSQNPNKLLSFRIFIDGEMIEENEGDGLIVSTPTGSTAYAMAAGGPIIDPRINANVIVPLSTHRPKTFPLVYPSSSKIEVELIECQGNVDVAVDGQINETAGAGDTIKFEKSERKAQFYKWKKEFYEKIKEKL